MVRAAGEAATTAPVLLVAALVIFVAGAALSAVTPMVTKLQLTSLGETGAVVGRLSGVGTAGAIVGTVLTGFVLISRVPVSGILVGLGVLLVVAAVAVEVLLHRRRPGLSPPSSCSSAGWPRSSRRAAATRRPSTTAPRSWPTTSGTAVGCCCSTGWPLVRRPRRPDAPGVRLRAVDRLADRHRLPAGRRSRATTSAPAG